MKTTRTHADITSDLTTNFVAEVAHYGEWEGFDILIVDVADVDPSEGWQVRHSYISHKGADAFVPLAFADGYNGMEVGTDVDGDEDLPGLASHLRLADDDTRDLIELIDHLHGLSSVDFHMLPTA